MGEWAKWGSIMVIKGSVCFAAWDMICDSTTGKVQGLGVSKMQNGGGHWLRGSVQGLSFALQGKTGSGHACVRTVSCGQDLHRSGVTWHCCSSSSAGREICASCPMLRKPTVICCVGLKHDPWRRASIADKHVALLITKIA